MLDLENRFRWAVAFIAFLALYACSGGPASPGATGSGGGGAAGAVGGATGGTSVGGSTGGTTAGATGFESDDPSKTSAPISTTADAGAGSGGSGGSGGMGGGAPPPPPPPSDDPARAIVEADILHVDGDTLYALAEYGGLSVIDIGNADDLKMLGRYTIRANPFEMYVRSGVAYAMYSSFPHYERDPMTGIYRNVVTSRIVAIDVKNPAAMKEIGVFDLPGAISDSRMVGDVVYVVSYENGNCWGCMSNQPRTTVLSIAVGDPASLRRVEQLTFDDQRNSAGWYRRSIHVNTERLYVSGMTYDGAWGADTGHSTIQVVDISDPAGRLALGAAFAVSGQIENRWQMDEANGVLRVVSQSGSTWTNGPPPVVETFTVKSAASVTPLGRLTLTLPRRENLKSVRFDGTRAYAVTFEQKDPLFTIDMTDPAAPKQVGEVEMPGFLHHMEPRGDRLVALGVDGGNANGGLTVSIFDVADLAHPTLLSRANFGSQWGSLPEDQDRIHKAFRLFDEKGLIVMPFSGWTNGGPTACGKYVSGVQLLDFSRDQVTARAIVPLRGNARRAFLHGDSLFALSDDQVASFRIDDRDAPVRRSALPLGNVANKTVRVGEYLVELGTDWWTSEPQIAVVPVGGGAQAVPVATLDLARAVNTSGDPCYTRYWSSFAANTQLFVEGSSVLITYDAGFAGVSNKGRMGFAVVDMSDPVHPVLRGGAVLEIVKAAQPNYGYPYYGCGVGYYTNPIGVWSSGDRIVKVGTTLVLQELQPVAVPADAGTLPSSIRPTKAILHAVDLSDPANIHLASSTTLAEGQSTSGLFVDGSRVFTSHQEDVAERPGRTRFFVDRIDFAAAAAPVRARMNVPGSLLSVEPGGERIATVDYRRTQFNFDADAQAPPTTCGDASGFVETWWIYGNGYYGRAVACVRIERTLRAVGLAEGGATLLDSHEPKGERVTGLKVGRDRIWIERAKYVPSTPTSNDYSTLGVETLTGIRSGHFDLASSLTVRGGALIPERDGTRFVINASSKPPRITVFDTADPAAPRQIFEQELSGGRYLSPDGISFDPRYLIWSMGKDGAMAIPLD